MEVGRRPCSVGAGAGAGTVRGSPQPHCPHSEMPGGGRNPHSPCSTKNPLRVVLSPDLTGGPSQVPHDTLPGHCDNTRPAMGRFACGTKTFRDMSTWIVAPRAGRPFGFLSTTRLVLHAVLRCSTKHSTEAGVTPLPKKSFDELQAPTDKLPKTPIFRVIPALFSPLRHVGLVTVPA